MPKLNPNLRHHSARPPSVVKPNLAVNQKPNYVPPPETASMPTPNPNPSSPGQSGVEPANARLGKLDLEEPDDDEIDDECDDDPDCDEDRLAPKLN